MRVSFRRRLLVPVALLAVSLVSNATAAADSALGTPDPAPTLAPATAATSLPSTPTPPTTPTATPLALATPTAASAAAEENSTPLATSVPLATPTETAAAPPTAVEVTPTPGVATATPSSSQVVGVQPSSVPLPSPAQLRMNARLRWGERVPSQVRRWAYLIVPAARRYHINPDLIAAVMTMESNGDPLAWSGADARGLMQILHGPWDPATNIDTGARMLAEFYAEFGSWPLALAAYNAGPGAVSEYNGIPPYRETRDYVIIVNYLFDLFDHHRLSVHRRIQYRSTVADLRHFKDQCKKVERLAHIAHLPVTPVVTCRHVSPGCGAPSDPFNTNDPFWPVANSPDPLQKVDPYAGSGT